jgi:hypothetical protein
MTMGYRTVQHVPLTRTYEEALKVFENSKPIKGRANEIRPLGQRRDADTYWVRKDGDKVQYMLYKTPVVTFAPDGVVVWTNGWSSVSTHQFINQVLDIGASGSGGKTLLHIGKEKFVLPGSDHVVLKWEGDGQAGNWSVLYRPQLTGLRINRKAANNVRARYKLFDDYFKGFLKLRNNDGVMRMTATELGNAIGYTTSEKPTYAISHKMVGASINLYRTGVQVHKFIDMTDWRLIVDSPYTSQEREKIKHVLREMQEKMLTTDHEEFYKAAMILCGCNSYNVLAYDENHDNAWNESVSVVEKIYKAMLVKLHAHEVLERIELPPGAVPNQKYEHWLTLLGEGEKK